MGGVSAHNPLPLEFRGFEVQQKRQPQSSDRKITGHLGDVGIIERADHLGVYNHSFVHDEIRLKAPDQLAEIRDRETLLLLYAQTAARKFDDECVIIEFLVEAGAQGVENLHR